MTRLGVVTLGQAPRFDVVPQMREYLPRGTRILEAGALDGLSAQEARAYRPGEGEPVLTTRMVDGGSVIVSKERLLSRLDEACDRVLAQGAEVVLLLCTGEFPELRERGLVAEPDRLLGYAVRGFRPQRLGVLIPLREQVAWAQKRWSEVSDEVRVVPGDPYGPAEAVTRAAGEFAGFKPDLVVLDCMGFREEHRRAVRQAVGAPVMLANAVVARLLAEVL